MRNILVLQHVAHEILGTLNPLLKERGLRIRYVNFEREPDARPTLDGYNGLIVLGGPMGVYDANKIPHLQYELKLIEAALKRNIPVLGICLGAQMIAHVLSADVRMAKHKEVGWHEVMLTDAGGSDPLFSHFEKNEFVFQLHGDSFEVPKASAHLALSRLLDGQAFRYGEKAYGLQFHLEVDETMILRWLKAAAIRPDMASLRGIVSDEQIFADTKKYVLRSLELSRQTFTKFIDLFGIEERRVVLGSGHGKPRGRLE